MPDSDFGIPGLTGVAARQHPLRLADRIYSRTRCRTQFHTARTSSPEIEARLGFPGSQPGQIGMATLHSVPNRTLERASYLAALSVIACFALMENYRIARSSILTAADVKAQQPSKIISPVSSSVQAKNMRHSIYSGCKKKVLIQCFIPRTFLDQCLLID